MHMRMQPFAPCWRTFRRRSSRNCSKLGTFPRTPNQLPSPIPTYKPPQPRSSLRYVHLKTRRHAKTEARYVTAEQLLAGSA